MIIHLKKKYAELLKIGKIKKKSKMKCSICNKVGHNKRTCKKMSKNVLIVSKNKDNTYINVSTLVNIDTPILHPMDRNERVNILKEHLARSTVKHEEQVMKLATLKEAHIYCVIYGVSSQKFGPLLEKFIRIKFNYVKNKAGDCTGDCFKDGKNSEVKVSLGGVNHNKFNFVQIRPSHKCDTYILTAYHLSNENVESEGELYVFKVPKTDIKNLVMSYGGYAHGTIKEHGKKSIDSLNNENIIKEYDLRSTINDNCWNALMEFRVPETAL